MKIIITESQFNLLIKEGVGTELEDYNPYEDGGMMKGTKKPLGEDFFPKNLVFKILDYCKIKLSGDSEVVNFENKIKNQNKIRRNDRKKMDDYLGIIMSDCRDTTLDTREKYPLMCLAVTDLIVGDSDNVFSVSYNPQWQNLKKNKSNVTIDEKWTNKYKRSIDCSNPKGFSQRAHCQGRKKRLKETYNYNKNLGIGVGKILGREYELDTTEEPFKFKIKNKNNELVSLIITSTFGDINIIDVNHVVEDFGDGGKKLVGYKFKGKSGYEKLIETSEVKKIINFIDDSDSKSIKISSVEFKKI